MTHGSLFSGIGGFDLAAEWMGWENIFHCEFDNDKKIQLSNIFKNSISYGDIIQTDFTIHRGKIDVLSGGFPCQDASNAKQDGNGQKGLQGSRTNLFFEMVRAVKEIKPKYVIAENVSNILKINGGKDFGRILSELSSMGYNAEWRVCRASEVGSPHKRARLYLVAYSSSIRLQQNETFFSYVHEEVAPLGWMSYGTVVPIIRGGYWKSEPPILCVDDGIPNKLAAKQIHGYGNAIVPQIAHKIFKSIQEYENINFNFNP